MRLSPAWILFISQAALVMANQPSDAKLTGRLDHVLETTPLIDRHNELPWKICEPFGNATRVHPRGSSANSLLRTEDGEVAPSVDGTPSMRGTLQHLQYDTFGTHWATPGIEDAYPTFALKPDGSIDDMTMWAVSPIANFIFVTKTASSRL